MTYTVIAKTADGNGTNKNIYRNVTADGVEMIKDTLRSMAPAGATIEIKVQATR